MHQQWGERLPSMKSTMHLYPIDGAAHDVAPEDTAWSYRDANWGAVYAGVDPDPANVEAIGAWSRGYQEALHPYSAGGAYVNMMMDEGPDRVRASYRGNFDRLTLRQARVRPGERVQQHAEHPAGEASPADPARHPAEGRVPYPPPDGDHRAHSRKASSRPSCSPTATCAPRSCRAPG